MTNTLLTIAGSDTLAGGGVQTDLKTIENHQIFGVAAITCIATQNERGFEIHDVSTQLVEEQLSSIDRAMAISGIKIGLLHQLSTITRVEQFIQTFTGPIVLDPVMAFKETEAQYHATYKNELVSRLFPYATIITPNLKEAELLSEMTIHSIEEMKCAAKKILRLGAKSVVIKGGERISGKIAYDLFYDGQQFVLLKKEKLKEKTINGAGCSFASAIASNLVLGNELISSVEKSKEFVYQSIKHGILLENGEGNVWFGQTVEEGNYENT